MIRYQYKNHAGDPMISKTALLAAIPVSVALLSGAALPFQAAGRAPAGHGLGDPLWDALASLVLNVIVAVAGVLLIRAVARRKAPARQP
jgi:transporter family-2 protein